MFLFFISSKETSSEVAFCIFSNIFLNLHSWRHLKRKSSLISSKSLVPFLSCFSTIQQNIPVEVSTGSNLKTKFS